MTETELKKDFYYPKRVIRKAINCSPSWINMILERPEFFQFRKSTFFQYAQNPVYYYRYCDELIEELKRHYRPRRNKNKKNFIEEKNE